MPGQLKASPRNQALGALADKLSRLKELGNKYQVLDQVPLLGGTGLGDLFLGQGPEEVSNWSYGNAPMQIPEMTRIPQMKKGRAESLADAVFMGADIGGLGALAGALGSKGLRNVASSASRVGPKRLVPQVGAIKPKGGNWVMDLKAGKAIGDPNKYVKVPGTENTLRVFKDLLPGGQKEMIANLKPGATDNKSQALNDWVENTLKKYVKNEMGTTEDPIRELADRGILHFELPENLFFLGNSAKAQRKAAGFPEEGFAQSDLGRNWEELIDSGVIPVDLEILKKFHPSIVEDNPWLGKTNQDPMLYSMTDYTSRNLGFNHLIDELANAINPESGLPRDLLLKYDALPRVTVPQAVERVAKINDWRAKQKIEADLAKSTNPATQLFKEYPDQGFKWVELRPNPELDPEHKALREALKYEGDTMGHCVGGYCDGVVAGDSKIYSLRDAKGQPHVTIEVAPKNRLQSFDFEQEAYNQVEREWLRSHPRGSFDENDDFMLEVMERSSDLASEWNKKQAAIEQDPRIVQIKGKANKAPKDEYLPFVRDFVQSGKWSEVNELENAGLIMKDGQFVIPDPEPEGFAEGGLVRAYNPEEIDQIVAQLIG